MRTWVVVLEATSAPASRGIGRGDVRALIEVLEAHPAALHSQDRCAFQLPIAASTQAEALYAALSHWDEAFGRLELAPWEIVRAEVLTSEEFERDVESFRSSLEDGGISSEPGEPEDSAEELIRRAFSDPLTNLKGQAEFQDRLEWVLTRSGGARMPAVLCLDVDQFRSVNARFGRTVGDQVLVGVAARLRAAVRPTDMVARLGGDQFAVLVEDGVRPHLERLAERLLMVVAEPFELGDTVLTVTAAVGIALSEVGDTAARLLPRALVALDAAKQCGGGTLAFLGPESSTVAGNRPTPAADAVQDHLAYLMLLHQATAAANESASLEEAAQAVVRQVSRYTGCTIGVLYVVSPRDAGLLVRAGVWQQGTSEELEGFRRVLERRSFSAGVGLPGSVLATGRPVWIPDLMRQPDVAEAEAAVAAGLRAAFALPVVVGTEVVAVLEFFSVEPVEGSGSCLNLLADIGAQLGRVVERTRAQAAVQASQAMLREAQALGRLGSWYTNLHTGETTWSEELYDLLGLSPSEAPPTLEAFLAVIHPEDRALVEEDVRKIDRGEGGETSLEFRVLRPDGELRWAVSRRSLLRSVAGEAAAFQMTIQDITDYRRLSQCAFTCEARWQIMLQGSQEVLSLLTEDGRIFFSLAPAGTVRLDPDDGSPTPLVDAVHPDDADIVREALRELLADPDECVAFVARFRGVDGWYWHYTIGTNLLDEPLIGAIVLNSHDVTSHKQLEEQLVESTSSQT